MKCLLVAVEDQCQRLASGMEACCMHVLLSAGSQKSKFDTKRMQGLQYPSIAGPALHLIPILSVMSS